MARSVVSTLREGKSESVRNKFAPNAEQPKVEKSITYRGRVGGMDHADDFRDSIRSLGCVLLPLHLLTPILSGPGVQSFLFRQSLNRNTGTSQ